MKKFKFKTSVGEFFGEFDETTELKVQERRSYENVKIQNVDKILGRNHGCLFDGKVHSIIRIGNGEYWLFIDLDDGYYGCPEYLLEILD